MVRALAEQRLDDFDTYDETTSGRCDRPLRRRLAAALKP